MGMSFQPAYALRANWNVMMKGQQLGRYVASLFGADDFAVAILLQLVTPAGMSWLVL